MAVVQQAVRLLSSEVDVDAFGCAPRTPPREDPAEFGARSDDRYVHVSGLTSGWPLGCTVASTGRERTSGRESTLVIQTNGVHFAQPFPASCMVY